MKEYKIMTVKISPAKKEEEKTPILENIKNLFFECDYCISAENAENLMQDMYKKGWEVLSVAPFGNIETSLLLITFEREF